MNYREERGRQNYTIHRGDWRQEPQRYDDGRQTDRYGQDLQRRDDRYQHDVRGPHQVSHRQRERRYNSPSDGYRRSPIDHRRRSNSQNSGRFVDMRDSRSRSRSRSRPRSRSRSRSNHRDNRQNMSRSRSYSSSSGSVSSSSLSSDEDELLTGRDESTFSKDQRTVFVSQLVMRATEKDIRRYFRRKVGCIVREVILLRDKRTRSHKGGAYIEMGRIEDVNKAVAVSGAAPDFQRFPLLVKLSEAEKNYVAPVTTGAETASMTVASSSIAPLRTRNCRTVEAQKVDVGGLDVSVTEEHLFALFSQFGELEKVTMQMDPGSQNHNGIAFLSFRDPKVANLAIHTMANKVIAGRPVRTGWASQQSSSVGVEVVSSNAFPEDSEARKQRALAVLEKLTGAVNSGSSAQLSDGLNSNSEANAKPVDPLIPDSTMAYSGVKGALGPSILVHNMFDKDTETEEGWAEELKDEFMEECSTFGKILAITVMSREAGGKIFASFDSVESAKLCAQNLSGRWFDKRQLRVEHVDESRLPDGHCTQKV